MLLCGGWVFVNNSLYWANDFDDKTKYHGLVKLDLSSLDFSKKSDEPQYIKGETIWKNKLNDQIISMDLKEKDGIIYFVTCDEFRKDGYCIIGAFDTDTESVKWIKKSTKLNGNGYANTYIVDDKFYVFDDGQGCYDIKTGDVIWENFSPKNQILVATGCFCQGIEYANGKFYFTNFGSWASSSMTGRDEKYIKNIECIDAKTGKYIWGDLPKGSGSLNVNPVVVKAQCFVVACDSLRVYDAEKGRLIGSDNTIGNLGTDYTASYKDMIIYLDWNYKKSRYVLTAIRAYDIK